MARCGEALARVAGQGFDPGLTGFDPGAWSLRLASMLAAAAWVAGSCCRPEDGGVQDAPEDQLCCPGSGGSVLGRLRVVGVPWAPQPQRALALVWFACWHSTSDRDRLGPRPKALPPAHRALDSPALPAVQQPGVHQGPRWILDW